MQPTQNLPNTYRKIGTLDVSSSERLLLLLNVIGLVLLVVSGWLFWRMLIWLRPEGTSSALKGMTFHSLGSWLGLLGAILGLTALHIIVHEAIHGVFFWLFTRTRPKFAFRWAYAYAAAPDWFIPRNPFLVTTLAPLVVISLAGIVLFYAGPTAWLLPTWLVISMNAAGAVGDIAVAGWLLRQPETCLAQDRGDAVSLYVPI